MALRTSIGKAPANLLLLRSSSKKKRRVETLKGIVPVKLLELAWKMVMSGNSSMKPWRLRSGPPKL